MAPELEKVLIKAKKQKDYAKSLLKSGYHESDFVCVQADGTEMRPDYVSQHFKSILDRLGYTGLNFHSLRHTAGTVMCNADVSVKTVQEFLGHSNLSTTSIYLHPDMKAKLHATKILSDLVNPKNK